MAGGSGDNVGERHHYNDEDGLSADPTGKSPARYNCPNSLSRLPSPADYLSTASENGVRQKTHFACWIKCITGRRPSRKYILLSFFQKS